MIERLVLGTREIERAVLGRCHTIWYGDYPLYSLLVVFVF